MRRGRPSTPVLVGLVLAGLGIVLLAWQWEAAWRYGSRYLQILSDPRQTQSFIEGYGAAAPAVFMLIQMAQVVLAPIPGEVTGFIGGYLFGTVAGFAYSSVALTAGSLVNFAIGRRLGRGFVARFVSDDKLKRFDRLFNERGIVVVFILFLFPGFPKDTFCLFLGLTSLPMRLLALMAAVGRMPGTLMLSLQGAAIFSRDYRAIAVVALFSIVVAAAAWRYRSALMRWAEGYRRD